MEEALRKPWPITWRRPKRILGEASKRGKGILAGNSRLRLGEKAEGSPAAPRWKICVYIRLSKEDARNSLRQAEKEFPLKSESVKNQKSILVSWIQDYFPPGTYEIVDFFEDDGQTGTDDMRESFMRMIGAIERGEGNCVVVKTLSRAFRNYSDQGYYLEEYFPSRNIRFISTMDSFVDTYRNADAVYSLDIPMYGVMNDRFAASTSRAVRKTLDDKRMKGKFIGAFPPWGFLKDPLDKNHLILDPDTAPIKLRMKDWLLHEGLSLGGVAKRLNEMGIPNPTKYKRLKGWKYHNPHAGGNDGLWCAKTVRDVLLNPMNAGHMVQGKQQVVSYKIHDKVSVPREEWFIVENTHEASFSPEDYDALCHLLDRKTRADPKAGTVHMFAGLIKCGRCKKAMHRSHGKGFVYFKCRTRSEKALQACSVKSIRQDRLEQAVLTAIQVQISLAGSLEDLLEHVSEEEDSGLRTLRKLWEDKRKELSRLQEIYDSLYGDWKTGEITEEEYRRMRHHYKEKTEQAKRALEKICEEKERLSQKDNVGSQPFENFLRSGKAAGLNRSLLLAMVDEICVYENNEITICFRFADELLEILENQESKKG